MEVAKGPERRRKVWHQIADDLAFGDRVPWAGDLAVPCTQAGLCFLDRHFLSDLQDTDVEWVEFLVGLFALAALARLGFKLNEVAVAAPYCQTRRIRLVGGDVGAHPTVGAPGCGG